MTPLGSLLAGALAQRIGAPLTLQIGACACFAGAVVFSRTLPKLYPLVRTVYAKKGILLQEMTADW
jgi:hypothetical protein